MQRYGARIRQVMLSNEWYRDNMPRYKAAFEDGLIELPADAEILADHRALVMEQGVVRVPERRSISASGKRRHGDSAIAGALAYFASQIETAEIAYEAAPRRKHFGRADGEETRDKTAAEPEMESSRRGRFGLHAGAW